MLVVLSIIVLIINVSKGKGETYMWGATCVCDIQHIQCYSAYSVLFSIIKQ